MVKNNIIIVVILHKYMMLPRQTKTFIIIIEVVAAPDLSLVAIATVCKNSCHRASGLKAFRNVNEKSMSAISVQNDYNLLEQHCYYYY